MDWRSIIGLSYLALVVVTIALLIHEKRDPVKAWAWLLVIALVPVAGMLIYMLFGRNHRRRKFFSRAGLKNLAGFQKQVRRQLRELRALGQEEEDFPEGSPAANARDNLGIITLLLNNSGALLTLHNRPKILQGGKQTFAAIFEALEGAQRSIHLEYYIFEDDRVGRRIGRILMQKARAGVEVRLIYDDVGSWNLSRRFLRKLRAAGVETGCFMPVAFPWLTSRVNCRNHRKILVVDGTLGFTGGVNIAERYLTGNHLGKWRDTHLQIEGEAVHTLQGVFMVDWYFTTRGLLPFKKYLPPIEVAEQSLVQIATSGPDSDWAAIMQAFFAAINRAADHIYIASPYFLPNQAILTALKVKALSGVDVRVLIPSRSDSHIVYWATRSYIGELIDAGIKVYLYTDGFNHAKLMMIDGDFCSVGTANMDMRSFEDNFEVSAILYDPVIAAQLERQFLRDLERSVRMTEQKWDERPLRHSIYESLARLFSPLL